MDLEKRRKVIKMLLDKTREGKVEWSETFSDDGYITTRDGVSIVVDKGSNDSGHDLFLFKLLNQYNDVVDDFCDEDFGDLEVYHQCSELYSLARGYAKGTEQLLDKLISSLDDVPF